MITSRPSSLGASTQAADSVRLRYELRLQGRSQPARLVARHAESGAALDSQTLKEMLPRLHALDVAIVRELRAGSVFGQLGDSQLARLLPLLAQRITRIGEVRLRVDTENALRPRVRVNPGPAGGLEVTMGLGNDREWVDLEQGRLIAGSQAYFLREAHAVEVKSPAPWELGRWASQPTTVLAGKLSSGLRDQMVHDLSEVGVPDEDLDLLAVRRGPPQKLIARLWVPEERSRDPKARLILEADYGGERVVLGGQKTGTPVYLSAGGAGGLTERDLLAEDTARRTVRALGFKYDRKSSTYLAHKEAALRALDPTVDLFPDDWVVDRAANAPTFHRDMAISAAIKLDEDRGLIDLSVEIDAIGEEETAAALVEMKDLLAWLDSGREYLRLGDGSFVSPSKRFRRNLNLLEHLGAEHKRVLISPLCVGLLRLLGDSAALRTADEATTAWLDELSEGSKPVAIEPPAVVADVLRDYQKRGLDWLAMLHRHRLAGILADDMGLGKTIQTLALLAWLREREGPKPSLVVAPTSVVTVWRDEAARFVPDMRVLLYYGPPKTRHALALEAADLVVTSYGILRRDAERLADFPFRYVILDEAQSAKNAASQNARAVRRLTSERRLALTGTPVENRPEELWAAFDFLAPGFMGSLRSFRKRYARPIGHGDDDALALLRARIQPLVLRRLKTEVAKELPPKIETTVRCELGGTQRALYDHVAGKLRKTVIQKIEKVGIERAQLDILAALTRLRQICCDPALLPTPEGVRTPPSAKLGLFAELMRAALASEGRVVVFSQFVQMQKRLITVIKELGVTPLWLHGGTRKRDRVVGAFQDPDGPPVIVVSLRAGGTGLTLTRADTVMHYDPWWNPAVERQATDRTHRLGQTHRVTVYKLICANTIEEKVAALAARKDRLAESLIASEGGAGAKLITKDDVLALLS